MAYVSAVKKALTYAILARRLHHQRALIAVSTTMGLALSVGLIWWEQREGLSIIDLGPLAVGFAILLLAAVMYQAIRQVGGSWAGIGIALGATLLISKLLPVGWPMGTKLIHTIVTVALLVGGLAFLMHGRGNSWPASTHSARLPRVRHDMSDIRQGRVASGILSGRFRGLGRKVQSAHLEPADVQDIVRQLRQMLPAEGWLTERLSTLRGKAYRMRQGHVARIDELKEQAGVLPTAARKALSTQLRDQYRELGFELRLERLDKTAAATEKKLREITREAERAARNYDFQKLQGLLSRAEKLQKHTTNLFKIIEGTEKRLVNVARKAAMYARGE